jgi:hypothetical protein
MIDDPKPIDLEGTLRRIRERAAAVPPAPPAEFVCSACEDTGVIDVEVVDPDSTNTRRTAAPCTSIVHTRPAKVVDDPTSERYS